MEIKTINPKEYGLELAQAKEIDKAFEPMIVERMGYVTIYEQILNKEINPDLCKEAGNLRKKLVKVRTGIAGIHKSQKAFFLAAGRYVDAWKNKETLPVEQMESNLRAIEEHYERIEQEKIKKLQDARTKLLEPYDMDVIPDNLGTMKEQDFGFFLNGVKQSYEHKKAEERRQEEEAIKERQRIAKIEAENARLLKEQQEREKKEKEAQQVQKDALQAELNKGDSDKIVDMINDIRDLKMKYSFKSEKHQNMHKSVRELLDKIIIYIQKNTE